MWSEQGKEDRALRRGRLLVCLLVCQFSTCLFRASRRQPHALLAQLTATCDSGWGNLTTFFLSDSLGFGVTY